MKFSVYSCKVRGVRKWRVDYEELGRRKRRDFPDQRSAKLWTSELGERTRTAKAYWAMMSEPERERVILAWQAAQERGIDLCDALCNSRPTCNEPIRKTLGEVIAEYTSAKRSAGRSADYIKIYELVLNQFAAGREAARFTALTLADVENFLNGKNLSYRPTVRATASDKVLREPES
jgi:hypothetical protein